MKTLQNYPSRDIVARSKKTLIACLFIAALALGVSGPAAAAAPEPYIAALRMPYQLENQSLELIACLPLENCYPTLDTGEPNPDYAFITACNWEVSADGGATWRNVDSEPGDSSIYYKAGNAGSTLIITGLKPGMAGSQYHATVTISRSDGQTFELPSATSQILNVKPSPLQWPASLTFDAAGNLYVADAYASVIWKITGDSKISVFAGSPSGETGTADATGTNARFNFPQGIAYQGGKFYVADSGNNAIRVITSGGAVTTLAGSPGRSGDYKEGAATDAYFHNPVALAADSSGNVYVVDSGNNVIRKITPAGVTSHVAGEYYTDSSWSGGSVLINGSGTMNYFNGGVTVDAGFTGTGGLVLSTTFWSGITVTGTISGGIDISSGGSYVGAVGGGGLVVTDTNGYFAGGSLIKIGGGDLTVGTSGTLLFDVLSSSISGDIINLSGVSNGQSLNLTMDVNTLCPNSGVCRIYLGNNGVYTSIYDWIIAMQLSGSTMATGTTSLSAAMLASTDTSVVAGNALADTAPDVAYAENASAYRFKNATGITISSSGTLYVADTGNNVITSISLSDRKLSVLDPDLKGVSGDPLADSYTKLTDPIGLRFDKNGNLYLADSTSSRIVKMTTSGSAQAQAVAGLANWLLSDGSNLQRIYPNSFQDGSASEALFYIPSDIAIDAAGNIYVADSANAAIRKITQSGTTVTVTTLMLTEEPPAADTSDSNATTESSGGGGALSM